MISNPKYGWCDFKLRTFEGTPSYLTDVPIDLLDAFIDYYAKGYSVVVFDEEGSYFTLVLTRYNWGIFLIEEKDYAVLHDFSEIKIEKLAKELIDDIERDLTGWSIEFATSDNPEEIEQHKIDIINKLNQLKEIIKYEQKKKN